MNITLGPPKITDLKPRITVVGIGGAGCNAINNMIATQLDGVEFVVANTDAQSLSMSNAEHRIQLGANLTEGLGAGARPEVGEAAAREAEEEIRAEIAGSHMVFIAAGMGGGTGTGAAAVVAEIARDLGILTVGIVSKPFQFEGARRMRTADAGIEQLEKCIDTLIVIPNQNLFRIANERTTFAEAFRLADQVLYSGIACIVDLIVKEGLINLDFADVQAVMKGMGTAMMGTGEATGEDRAMQAASEAIANPLLDNITLSGAQGLLISIVGGTDLTLYEVDTAASHIRKEVAAEANIIVGATTEAGMDERIRVSIVASGISGQNNVSNEPSRNTDHSEATTGLVERATLPPTLPAEVIDKGGQSDNSGTKLNVPNSRTPSTNSGIETIHHSGTEQSLQPEPETEDSDLNISEADEFARALSEAMDASALELSTNDDSSAAWQSSNGVTVEEGFASVGEQRPPPLPLTKGTSGNQLAPSFESVPPSKVRRQHSRMPDMSEFPEVAQREYFAKMEAAKNNVETGQRNALSNDQKPNQRLMPPADIKSRDPSTPATARADSKPGLLRRLTGGGRK